MKNSIIASLAFNVFLFKGASAAKLRGQVEESPPVDRQLFMKRPIIPSLRCLEFWDGIDYSFHFVQPDPQSIATCLGQANCCSNLCANGQDTPTRTVCCTGESSPSRCTNERTDSRYSQCNTECLDGNVGSGIVIQTASQADVRLSSFGEYSVGISMEGINQAQLWTIQEEDGLFGEYTIRNDATGGILGASPNSNPMVLSFLPYDTFVASFHTVEDSRRFRWRILETETDCPNGSERCTRLVNAQFTKPLGFIGDVHPYLVDSNTAGIGELWHLVRS